MSNLYLPLLNCLVSSTSFYFLLSEQNYSTSIFTKFMWKERHTSRVENRARRVTSNEKDPCITSLHLREYFIISLCLLKLSYSLKGSCNFSLHWMDYFIISFLSFSCPTLCLSSFVCFFIPLDSSLPKVGYWCIKNNTDYV